MDFGNLYTYSTTKGIVIPETLAIREKVIACFQNIFGNSFDTSTESIGGRLIEAITFLFLDVVGINAQNASFLNPNNATGVYLDNLGAIFGVTRLNGESDSAYRDRIIGGQSVGVGFEKSIMSAVASVSGVTSVCVLNNGDPDSRVIPNNAHGVAVDAHSVYICVGGGNDSDVAVKIADSISAGCGYTDSGASTEYGTKSEVSWTDSQTGTPMSVRFYRPIATEIKISSVVVNVSHDATTIEADVKEIIAGYISGSSSLGLDAHNTNCTVTPQEIMAAVASKNIGAYIQSCTFQVKGAGDVFQDVDSFTFFPYTAASLPSANNIVTVL